jgi:1-acyl-sn-glycerol-3-phosphate acyltransferase
MEARLGVARSLWWWAWFLLWCALYALAALPVLLLTAPFRRVRWRVARRANRFWAQVVLAVAFGRHFEQSGLQNLPPASEPHVVVANHQSLLDVVVTHALPRPLSWVVKRATFVLPVFGFFLWAEGDLPLVVGDAESGARLRERAVAALHAGSWVLLYPEGSRTPDGEVHRFRRGAFEIARAAGVGIVPVMIEGSRGVLPKHGLRGGSRLWPHPVSLQVLDPIPPAEVAAADAGELAARTRALIAAAARADRKRRLGG